MKRMNRKSTNVTLLEVAKWVTVLLVLIFLIGKLSANRSSNTSFEDMSAAVCDAAALDTMQLADNQMVKRLYGLDPNDYEGVLLYYPTSNMGAEELLLVKLSSTDQLDTVTDAVNARVQSQKNSFEGYGVSQYEMLENCVIETTGNYVLLVVASDPTPVRQAFKSAL